MTICILASPVIGMIIGSFSKGFRGRTPLVRAAIALSTLYFSAGLFGAVGGAADFVLRGSWRHTLGGLTIESVWYFVVGLTMTGYFIVLWPLAYLNHSLIADSYPKRD